MYCSQCGHDNSKDINFCSGCGKPIPQASQPQTELSRDAEAPANVSSQPDGTRTIDVSQPTGGVPESTAEAQAVIPPAAADTPPAGASTATAGQEDRPYVFKAKTLARHKIGIVVLVFYGIMIIPMMITSIFQETTVSPVFMIFVFSMIVGVIVLFSLLIVGSMKKVITIDSRKIVQTTPFRTRTVLWSDITEVVHFTQTTNGITTARTYRFNDGSGRILFAMPEKGAMMFKGDENIVEVLFYFYDKHRKSRTAHVGASVPTPGQNMPVNAAQTSDSLKDMEFKSGIGRKVTLIGLSAFFTLMLAASMTTATSEQVGMAVGAGLAFILLVNYLTFMNATARLTVAKDCIRYKNMFRKEELVIPFSVITKITDDTFYFFHYLEIDAAGRKHNLKGLRFHNIKRITALISQRVQLYRANQAAS